MWFWSSFQSLGGFGGIFQILVLSILFYYTFLFFRGTRAVQVLVGLALLLLVLITLTQVFNLDALTWLLRRFFVYLAIALLIIFQPEIRSALAELGRQPALLPHPMDRRTVVDNILEAVTFLADHKVGALVAIQREIGTRSVQDTGIKLNAPIVPELLTTIFFPHTPLHDGGVIIEGDRIAAAGCVFPLSNHPDLMKSLGTRHRAAIGLSEETDAVVIIVSEETGVISVSNRGRLIRGLDTDRLRRYLTALLVQDKDRSTRWWQVGRHRPSARTITNEKMEASHVEEG
jgi:diadenylate cyclase